MNKHHMKNHIATILRTYLRADFAHERQHERECRAQSARCDSGGSVVSIDRRVLRHACEGSVGVSFSEQTTPGSCADNYTITRTWTATDSCGNVTTGTQTITVVDTTAPTLSGCPSDASVQCLSQVPAAANVTASDTCGSASVTLTETQSNPGSSCNNVITRTWKATDAYGNSATCTQTITVAPLINPADCIVWHAPLAQSPSNEDTDPSNFSGIKSPPGLRRYAFKGGSTIPIKVHVQGCATATVTTNPNVIGEVNIYADMNCDGVPDDNELPIDYNGVGGPGGLMVKVDSHLKYKLDTKSLTTQGCYILEVVVTDVSTGQTCKEKMLLQRR